MKHPYLSVVIPAFNEEKRLGKTLETVSTFLRKRGDDFELLVVDDGSTDSTAHLVEEFSRTCPDPLRLLKNRTNRGKGYSVRKGMLGSRGAFALVTDADLSAPIEELAQLEEHVVRGPYQIAIASRALGDSRVLKHQPFYRELTGKVFNRVMRAISKLPFSDTQCGFKLFEMSSARPVFQAQLIEGFGFDVEILYIANKWGLRIRETPVVWRDSSGSKVNFRSGMRAAIDLAVIRRNDRDGRYSGSDQVRRGGSLAPEEG